MGEAVKVAAIIPARYASTRFPGKPLALILGKPMIQWTVEGAKKSRLCSEVIVATDDERIAEAAKMAGARVEMTPSDLPSGSDRINWAARNVECDVVINVQGDEPLVTGELIDKLADALIHEPNLQMATLAHPLSDEDLHSLNAVKVLLNQRDEAIYFSRLPIPYTRQQPKSSHALIPLKHMGMYGYRKKFLQEFCAQGVVPLEESESLEQLRALYMGAAIKVLRVDQPVIGIDTPADLEKLENHLKAKGGLRG